MAGVAGIGARAVDVAVDVDVDVAVDDRAGDGDDEEQDADVTLVARARTDRTAFAALYRRYVDPIYRYCYRRLGTREAAEDATAAVFAKALAALPGFREGSFRAWLFAIAHNTIANEFRARAARPERALGGAEAQLLADPAPSPEESALAAEARANILGLLPRLPEDQRRVLELRLAGLSGPEIAGILGRSPGSVRVAQFRAIGRLRGWLAEPGAGAGARPASAAGVGDGQGGGATPASEPSPRVTGTGIERGRRGGGRRGEEGRHA